MTCPPRQSHVRPPPRNHLAGDRSIHMASSKVPLLRRSEREGTRAHTQPDLGDQIIVRLLSKHDTDSSDTPNSPPLDGTLDTRRDAAGGADPVHSVYYSQSSCFFFCFFWQGPLLVYICTVDNKRSFVATTSVASSCLLVCTSPRSRDRVHSSRASVPVVNSRAVLHFSMSQVTLNWLTLNINGQIISKAASDIQKTAITCGWTGPKSVSMISSQIL